jgi:hypothetical protein
MDQPNGQVTDRDLARKIAIGRIAVGASVLFTTRLFALVFAGREAARDRRMRIAGRLFGIRDIAIGLATIDAIDQGQPAGRLVQLGTLCDVTDFVIVLAGATALPWRGRLLGWGLANGFAAAGAKALSAKG